MTTPTVAPWLFPVPWPDADVMIPTGKVRHLRHTDGGLRPLCGVTTPHHGWTWHRVAGIDHAGFAAMMLTGVRPCRSCVAIAEAS